jgi:hypothetical protein
MALDLSNDYARNTVGLVGLFLPMFALIKAYKVARYQEYRTGAGYWTTGLLLVGCISFYAFVLDYRGRIILGGVGLLILAMMLVVNFFNNR